MMISRKQVCPWSQPVIRHQQSALNSYKQQIIEDTTQIIRIDRQSPYILRDVIRLYKRPGFNPKSIPDIEFVGERGIDGGGLTREFSHMVLSKIRDGDSSIGITLFEGAEDHIVPIHCSSSLESGLFQLFGKIFAHSIPHGGMGFVGMSPACAKFIATKSLDEAATLVSLDDIPDLEYRMYAQKVYVGSYSNEKVIYLLQDHNDCCGK